MDRKDAPPPVTDDCQPSPALREWLRGTSPMLKAQFGAARIVATAAGIHIPS